MSLKIEQRLDYNSFTQEQPKLYTTGAKLVPLEINQNSKKRFVWVVDEFCEDNFDVNGKLCSPSLYSENLDTLITID